MSLKNFIESLPELSPDEMNDLFQKMNKEEITMENLMAGDIKEDDLITLGVKIGTRKKILRVLKGLSQCNRNTPHQTMSFGASTVTGNNNCVNSGNSQFPREPKINDEFINFTQKEVVLFTESGDVLRFPPKGFVKLSKMEVPSYQIHGVTISQPPVTYKIEGFPRGIYKGRIIATEDVCEFARESRLIGELVENSNLSWFCLDNSPEMVIRDKEGEGSILGFRGLIQYV